MNKKSILKLALIPLAITLFAFGHRVHKRHQQAHVQTQKTDVILDFNGVVFEINKNKAGSVLGIGNVISYAFSGGSPKNLKNIMFDVLYKLDAQLGLKSNGSEVVHEDMPLPLTMTEWMRGTLKSNDIINKLRALIEQLDNEGYFKNDKEKQLINKLACVFFDPCTRVKLYKPIKKTVQLIKQCKAQGHRVYLLSNIDTELIELLKAEHPEVFNMFDGMVLSANVNMIKPDANIYAHTVRKFGMNPNNVVFLDDEATNVEGATQAGIKGIQFNEKQYKGIKRELAQCGVVLDTKRAVQVA